jgi:SAM-dependent methyltransferase
LGKPIFFKGPFFPKPEENRMAKVGDSAWVREDFAKRRPNNIEHLLYHRYHWMNQFINDGDLGLEIGCGAGFSEYYIKNKPKRLWLSDCMFQPWHSLVTDGMVLPFRSASLDFIVAVDVIHHLAKPLIFFKEVRRVLKPRGRLMIKDVHASLVFRFILRWMRHEGYSYDVDPLNLEQFCNDPTDPWSGNNAVADLMFNKKEELEQLTNLKTIHHALSESMMLYLSGGVTARRSTPQFPIWMLKVLKKIDQGLCVLAPKIFPSGREWVLEKSNDRIMTTK